MVKALVTGAGGLIGASTVSLLCREGWHVIGIDNDMRQVFFGAAASTAAVVERHAAQFKNYHHYSIDIRDRGRVSDVVRSERPDFIIHAAAQPSHDKAAQIPFDDFDVNAVGTLNLLEAARQFCKDAPFCFTSTNKVYGEHPNDLPLKELPTRYDYSDGRRGIDETMPIDQCLHSLFGASKVAADVLCQEYGRYFNMPVGVFRGGCLTGEHHCAVELHGYLAYIVRCAVRRLPYTIFGYGGKQVRDQIHSEDVARLFVRFYESPRLGEVYNLGGGRENSISILETIETLGEMGYPLNYKLDQSSRRGDHICYITDLAKVGRDFPEWQIEHSLEMILIGIIDHNLQRLREELA